MTTQPEYTPILVELLARERALFRPNRVADWGTNDRRGRGASTKHQLQAEFRVAGLRLAGGGNTAGRKAKERLLGDMQVAGLVTSGGKERQTLWKLTDGARWIAAALSLNPSIADGHYAVNQLLSFAPAGKLVSELLPSGLENYSGGREVVDAFLWAQDLLLPALVAGWVESFSDLYGRAAYKVTPEGEAAANAPAPEPPDDLPRDDDELGTLYWKCYGDEVQRLQRIPTPDHNNIAPLPLSAGLWNTVFGPWTKSESTIPSLPSEEST